MKKKIITFGVYLGIPIFNFLMIGLMFVLSHGQPLMPGTTLYNLFMFFAIGGMLIWFVAIWIVSSVIKPEAPKDYEKSVIKENMVILEQSKKLNKDNPDGIDIKLLEDNYFIFVGKFSLGELGVCSGAKIRIYYDGEDIERQDLSRDEALKKVKDYILERQEAINNNVSYLKNYFLTMLIETYMENENPFWEKFMLAGYNYADYEEIGLDDVLTEKEQEKIENALNKFDEVGITKKISFDAEKFIKTKFKWFDYDAFMKTIDIENVSFDIVQKRMSIQLSDKNNAAFCGAYDEFDENMSPCDWHNF